MSKRSFRLSTVLRVRRAQEESARADLSRDNRRVREAADERDHAMQHFRMVPQSSGAVSAAVFRREQAAADMAAARAAEANAALTRAQARATQTLNRWREAAQRVEALERLRHRQLEELRAELARAEHAVVDDLVSARFKAGGDVDASSGGLL